MGKYKESNFCQVYNKGIKILNEHNKKVPYSTKWLYIHLTFLEHRFTGREVDYFFRSIGDIQRDTKMGRRQIIKGIKTLEELDLIDTWQIHWKNKETGRLSERHISAFRITEV